MLKKVFFIIEENEEMYIQGLDNICVYYKRSNLTDLQEKIEHYIIYLIFEINNILSFYLFLQFIFFFILTKI